MFKKFVYLVILYGIACLCLRAGSNEYTNTQKKVDTIATEDRDYIEKQLKVSGDDLELTVSTRLDGYTYVTGSCVIANESRIKRYDNVSYSIFFHATTTGGEKLEELSSLTETIDGGKQSINLAPQMKERVAINMRISSEEIEASEIDGHSFIICAGYEEQTADFNAICNANKKEIFITFLLAARCIAFILLLLYKRKGKYQRETVKPEKINKGK